YKVVYKSLSKIDTSSIITNPEFEKKINEEGIKAQKAYVKDINTENFIRCSYEFSKNIGLFNSEIEDMIDEFNEFCIGSSMAMIGNTVFGFTKDTNSISKEYSIANIDNKGIRIEK
ncbi:MAG: hypothetical protein ACI37V_07810, partial [Methanobrevibacter sp.]